MNDEQTNNTEEVTEPQQDTENVSEEQPQANDLEQEGTASTEVENDTETTETAEEENSESEALEKANEKFLRLYAEFENYKRRTSKERIELYKTANADLMQELLPILDDFKRGRKELEKNFDEKALEGFDLITSKLIKTLSNKGLELIVINQGDAFDAETQEAITQIPAPEESLKGKILDVIEDGYKLGEKIIRFPKVVIGT